MNRHKGFQKILNWFLSLVLIVTSISVPGVAVSAEDETSGFSDVIVSEDDEGETSEYPDYPDYSDVIAYNLTYNEDNSKATLTISVDTEDDVSLDFGNNDELSEKMGGESPSYSINYDISTEDGKTYAFDIVKNGDYNFQAIVLPEGEDFDGQTVGSKDISIQVTDLVEGEVESPEYETQETQAVKDWTFDITQKNVQLAYYNWQAGNPPTSEVTLNTITQVTDENNKTSQIIKDYIDPSNSSGGGGYVVVFVKPNENCLFTGLGATGAGQCFAVKETFNKNDYLVYDSEGKASGIGNYPGLQYVVAAAYKAGYKAAFGWSRKYNEEGSTLSFQTTAVQPSATISVAAPADTSNVKPGDTLDFTVTIKPKSETNSTVDQVLLTSINGVTLSEPITCTKDSSGNYIATVPYTITQADFESGKVNLTVSGSVQYNCSFGMSAGSVESACTVVTTASVDAAPGPNFAEQATVKHQFESATTGMSLHDDVKALCSGDKKIPVGVEYTPANPTTTRVDVAGGYWSFEGWNPSSVTPTTKGQTVTVTGKWKFVKSISIEAPKDVVYNGTSQEQKPVVKDADNKVLTEGTDYSLTYSQDTTNNGTVKVQVIGKNGYDSGETSYEITKRPIKFVGKSATKTYTGQEQTITGFTVSTDAGCYELVKGHTASLNASASGTEVKTYTGTIDTRENVKITATDGTDVTGNYSIETEPGSLTITSKAINDGTLSVNDPKDVVYDGNAHPFLPKVTTEAGTELKQETDYDVSYTRENKTTDDFTNCGEIVVTITGKNNYSGSIVKTYSITQRPITFKGNSDTKTYNGEKQTVTGYTISTDEGQDGLVNGHEATLTASSSGTKAGKHNGEISDPSQVKIANGLQDVTSNYSITTQAGTLTITAKDLRAQDISVDGLSDVTYNGKDQKQPPTVTDGTSTLKEGEDYTISYSSSKTDDYKNAETTITVTISGKGNYSGSIEKSYSITKAPLTITTKSKSKVYDGSPLTAGGELEGLVNGETAPLTTSGSQTDVGTSKNTYTIDWNHATAKKDNYSIQEKIGVLKVEAQHLTPDLDPKDPSKEDPNYKDITADDPKNLVYDGDAHKFIPVVTGSENQLTPGKDYEVTYTTEDGKTTNDFTNCGKIAVTITGIGNYSGKIVKTYSITPRSITFVGNSNTKTYNGEEQTVKGYTISTDQGQDGLVKGHEATLSASASGTKAGEYAGNISDPSQVKIKNGLLDVTSNYSITTKAGTLTITAKNLIDKDISVDGLSDVTYNGKDRKQTPTVTDGTTTLKEGEDYTISYSSSKTDDYKNAETTITVTISGKGNYTGNIEKSYSITKAPLTVTTKSASKVYDGEPLTADGKLEGLVNGETAPLTTSGSQTEVGQSDNGYTIEWEKGTADPNNYDLTSVSIGKLTVTKSDKEIVITSSSESFTYDGKAHESKITVSGLPKGYTAKYTADTKVTDVTDKDGVQSKITDIKIFNSLNQDVTTEYSVTTSVGTIKITPATLKVTTDSAKQVYDGKPLQASGSITGFVEGEDAKLTTTGSQTDVGTSKNTYTIDWDHATAKKDNYSIQEEIGSLEVEAQHLTPDLDPKDPSKEDPNYKGITADDPKNLVYDGEEHKFIPVVTGSEKNQLKSGKDYKVTYTREDGKTTNDFTNCGKIVVTIKGIGNYSGKIVKTYSITPRSITFVGNSDTKTYNGEQQKVEGYTVSKAEGQDGLVKGHKADVTASASGTDAGSYKGTVEDVTIKTSEEVDVTANYSIKTTPGTLTIKAKDLDDKDISVKDFSDLTYDGTEQKQEPTVTDGTTALEKDKDYTVSYSSTTTDDYTNAGTTITVTITGKGNYTGSARKTYSITPATLTVKTESADKVYDGKELTAKGSITGFVNNENAPFEVVGSQTDVGTSKNTYTIDWDHATAKKDNYSIQEEIGVLKVEAQHLAPEDDPKDPSGTDPNYKDITINNPEDLVYDGDAHKFLPEVTTKDGSKLTPGTDYDVSYTDEDGKDVEDFTNAGDNITVTITGKGNYSGTVEKTYKIKKAALTIKMESATKVYDGKRLTAAGSITGFVGEEAATLTVTGSQTKVGESDNTYNLDWNGTAKASNYTITVEKGTLTVEAQHITPTVDAEDPDKKDPNYSGVTTNDPEDVVYDGDEHKFVPEVTTKDGTKLIPGVDYEIIYPTDDFTNPGEKKVIIIGKGNYAGTIEKSYKILEKEETDPETGNKDTDNTTNKNDSDTRPADDTKQASATKTASKPAASTTSQNTSTPVRTGDTSNLILWLSLLILAIATVGVTISIKRKR